MIDNSNINKINSFYDDNEEVVEFDYIDFLLDNLTKIKKYYVKRIIDYPVASHRVENTKPTTFHFFCTIEIKTDITVKKHQIQVNYFSDSQRLTAPYIEITHLLRFLDFLNNVFGFENVFQISGKNKFQTINKSQLSYSPVKIKKIKFWNTEF